jgi:E3 ubiquitin-protein ligase CHFR
VKKVKTSDIEKLGTEMNCGICLDYIFECVSILDCLHNFCGGCLSDWINKNNK